MKQALGIFMKALNPFMSVDTIFIVLALIYKMYKGLTLKCFWRDKLHKRVT
jgi:hypothetical protein